MDDQPKPSDCAKQEKDGSTVDGKQSGSTEESKETSEVKDATKEEDEYTSPELEKYWKTVKENPADFTGWTYLLQYVEQEVNS